MLKYCVAVVREYCDWFREVIGGFPAFGLSCWMHISTMRADDDGRLGAGQGCSSMRFRISPFLLESGRVSIRSLKKLSDPSMRENGIFRLFRRRKWFELGCVHVEKRYLDGIRLVWALS